jgi:hypothetical protein
MKKSITIALLLISGSLLAAAQEVPSRVVETSQYYDAETYKYAYNPFDYKVKFIGG